MSDLTLLDKLLLRDVANGDVSHVESSRTADAYDINHHTRRTCTARMREFEATGWVHLPEWTTDGPRRRFGRSWRLTDAGRAMLDTHPVTPGGAP